MREIGSRGSGIFREKVVISGFQGIHWALAFGGYLAGSEDRGGRAELPPPSGRSSFPTAMDSSDDIPRVG